MSNAALLTPDDESDPNHVCPCKKEATCPRIWGTHQYDSLLGNFKPCIEPGFVRCCGVRTHESHERSNEDSEEKSDINYAKPQRNPARVIPPGIVVPVPFQFPEYIDYRTSTTTTTTIEPPSTSVNETEGDNDDGDDEGSIEGDVEDESGEWVYVDEYSEEVDSTPAPSVTGSLPGLKPELDKVESENIDHSNTSQSDNLVSSNPLDYSGVDKASGTERDMGTNIVSNGIKDEMDSSKDDKKNEEIVTDGKIMLDVNPELPKSGENIDEEVDISEFTVSKELQTETPESSETDENIEEVEDLESSTEVTESVTSLPDDPGSKEEMEKEKSESAKEESSKIEREVSSNLKDPEDVKNNGAVVGTVESIPETNKDNIIPSTESPSTETTTPSSNLMNILTGNPSSNIGANSEPDDNKNFNKFPSWVTENIKEINRVEDIGVWHIANRAYVPVLINAGFLKDRPTATGPIGLDPLSGVTHSDIADPELAPELLPLSCGNVVFGERFRNGKTLVCEIPQANELPVKFFQENVSPVSKEKFRGPPLPGAFLPAGVLTSSDGLDSTKLLPTTTTTTVTYDKVINSRRPVRKRIVIKRPVPLAPTNDDVSEKEATTTTPKPVENQTDRSPIIDYDLDTQKQGDGSPNVIEPPFEIESKNTNNVSISVSVSPSTTLEESAVSTPITPVEASNSETELAAELAKADQEAKDLLSQFYVLPLAPVLPPKPKGSRNSTSKRLRPKPPASLPIPEPEKVVETASEEPTTTITPVSLPTEPTKVVEVVSENSTTTTPVSLPTEPTKVVEVVNEKPATTTPVSLPTEPAKVVDEVTEAPRRRVRVGKKRPRPAPGKKVTRTSRDTYPHVISNDNLEAATKSLKRNTRQVQDYRPNGLSSERKVISVDQISPAGKLNIIGPIPSGFYKQQPGRKDPFIELPKPNRDSVNFRPGVYSQIPSGISGDGTLKDDTFKPSPVDPIKWN